MYKYEENNGFRKMNKTVNAVLCITCEECERTNDFGDINIESESVKVPSIEIYCICGHFLGVFGIYKEEA